MQKGQHCFDELVLMGYVKRKRKKKPASTSTATNHFIFNDFLMYIDIHFLPFPQKLY